MPRVTQPLSGRAWIQSQVCLMLKMHIPAIHRRRRKESEVCILKFSGWLPSCGNHNSLHGHFLLKSKWPNNTLIIPCSSGFVKHFPHLVFETVLSGSQSSYGHPLVRVRKRRLRGFALYVKAPQLQVGGGGVGHLTQCFPWAHPACRGHSCYWFHALSSL